MLRPPPVARPNELVRLVQVTTRLGARSSFTPHTYRALTERAKGLAAVFGYHETTIALRDLRGARSIACHVVSGKLTLDIFR